MGANATAKLSAAPEDLLLAYGVTVVNFLGMHSRLPAANCALVSVRDPNQDQPSQLGPPGAGRDLKAIGKGAPVRRGPLAKCTRLEKSQLRLWLGPDLYQPKITPEWAKMDRV